MRGPPTSAEENAMGSVEIDAAEAARQPGEVAEDGSAMIGSGATAQQQGLQKRRRLGQRVATPTTTDQDNERVQRVWVVRARLQKHVVLQRVGTIAHRSWTMLSSP